MSDEEPSTPKSVKAKQTKATPKTLRLSLANNNTETPKTLEKKASIIRTPSIRRRETPKSARKSLNMSDSNLAKTSTRRGSIADVEKEWTPGSILSPCSPPKRKSHLQSVTYGSDNVEKQVFEESR